MFCAGPENRIRNEIRKIGNTNETLEVLEHLLGGAEAAQQLELGERVREFCKDRRLVGPENLPDPENGNRTGLVVLIGVVDRVTGVQAHCLLLEIIILNFPVPLRAIPGSSPGIGSTFVGWAWIDSVRSMDMTFMMNGRWTLSLKLCFRKKIQFNST